VDLRFGGSVPPVTDTALRLEMSACFPDNGSSFFSTRRTMQSEIEDESDKRCVEVFRLPATFCGSSLLDYSHAITDLANIRLRPFVEQLSASQPTSSYVLSDATFSSNQKLINSHWTRDLLSLTGYCDYACVATGFPVFR